MDELFHYGTPRHSGRYPWGSGEDPYQHENFYVSYRLLKEKGLDGTGLTDKEIAEEFNMSRRELDYLKSKSTNEHRAAMAQKCIELASEFDANGDRLYSNVRIAEMVYGDPKKESMVRNVLKDGYLEKRSKATLYADRLKYEMNENGKLYLDVGLGSELDLGCTENMKKMAIQELVEQGYTYIPEFKVPQLGTGKQTTIAVLAPPGTTLEDISNDRLAIKTVGGTSEVYDTNFGFGTKFGEGGSLSYPESIDKSRVYINYADENGVQKKDGVIELRRGVDDISLGAVDYAQVRIMVDGTHYMKGMAMYSDNIPDGYDIIYNTNKAPGTADEKVFKPLEKKVVDGVKTDEINTDNPFGAEIKKQLRYVDENGNKVLSKINIVNEEGDWKDTWSSTISAQMLSKQPEELIRSQLSKTYADKLQEYNDILQIENPEIRKHFLNSFAEDCDASAVHLKASPFPGQSWNVILPLTDIPDNEIYAPNYEDGDTVVLIRYPHAGTFEIPQLVVNNSRASSRNILGDAKDAVGISLATASKLSGADFDGDTALVIPCNSSRTDTKIKVSPSLKGVSDFDTKANYGPKVYGWDGDDESTAPYKVMKFSERQLQMGMASNLITDMTLRGADDDEMARAVKYSMVVVDAPKHKLNYQAAEKDYNIEELRKLYQIKDPETGRYGGASTLISSAKSETHIDERKEGVKVTDPETGKTKVQYIDPNTGEKLYSKTNATITKYSYKDPNSDSKKAVSIVPTKEKDADGNMLWRRNDGVKVPDYIVKENGFKEKVELKKEKSTKMADTKDAHDLSTGLYKEEIYANYANQMKALANTARKEYLSVPSEKVNKEAKQLYSEEVKSLKAKVIVAEKNAPRERQAQILGYAKYKELLDSNPGMTFEEKKKLKAQCLSGARIVTGAKKERLGTDKNAFTDREWEAILRGAVSASTLQEIIRNSDDEVLRNLAMPKTSGSNALSVAQIQKISSMSSRGYTTSEIADSLGVSVSTVDKYTHQKNEPDFED